MVLQTDYISYNNLTKREKEVLVLIAIGYRQKEIADELNIGVRTVQTHRNNLKDKTGLTTNRELFRYALDNGYLDSIILIRKSDQLSRGKIYEILRKHMHQFLNEVYDGQNT